MYEYNGQEILFALKNDAAQALLEFSFLIGGAGFHELVRELHV